jgi:MoxR-like ATPase
MDQFRLIIKCLQQTMALRAKDASFTTNDQVISALNEQSQAHSEVISQIFSEISKSIVGQKDVVEKIMVALISDGHVLLESVPGLAKTLLAKTISDVLGVSTVRIQFTPDLLPADILGTKIYKKSSEQFDIEKGPIFNNFILADEINRAPPKVQSALLEAMQEKQVTIHGETFALSAPFLVMATQNPIESEGTYKLPDAQVDRFAMKILISYPSIDDEKSIIARFASSNESLVNPVITSDKVIELQKFSQSIYVDESIINYVTRIVDATRNPQNYNLDLKNTIEFGASPRASLWLIKTAKALALIHGRGFVIPEDIKSVAHEVLRHRIILSFEADVNKISADQIVDTILENIQIS